MSRLVFSRERLRCDTPQLAYAGSISEGARPAIVGTTLMFLAHLWTGVTAVGVDELQAPPGGSGGNALLLGNR
jgi:hypothetical protein